MTIISNASADTVKVKVVSLTLIVLLYSVDGGWTLWSVWSDCSVTCGQGSQVRTRACINPPPRNNGTNCSGLDRDFQKCYRPPCLGLYSLQLHHLVVIFQTWRVTENVTCELLVFRRHLSLVTMVAVFPQLWGRFCDTTQSVCV